MAEGFIANAGNWVEDHPIPAVAIGVGVVLLLWWLSSGSDAPAQVVDNSTGNAAAVAAAQIAANRDVQAASIAAQTQQNIAQISANSVIQQSADQLAAILSGNATAAQIAHAQGAAEISANNAQVAIAQIQGNTYIAENYNNAVVSQFQALAASLVAYGTNLTNQQAGVAKNVNDNIIKGYQSYNLLLPPGYGGSYNMFGPGVYIGQTTAPQFIGGGGASNGGGLALGSPTVEGEFANLGAKIQPLVSSIPQSTGPFSAGNAVSSGL